MSNVKLAFYPQETGVYGHGNYDMFIDFDSSLAPSTMVFDVPAGLTTQAIKLYQATLNAAKKVKPDPQKNTDKGNLNSGQEAKYLAVFSGAALPAGFYFDAATSTLISTGQTDGIFEFLIWIKDGSGDNDYLDPGIKNHL